MRKILWWKEPATGGRIYDLLWRGNTSPCWVGGVLQTVAIDVWYKPTFTTYFSFFLMNRHTSIVYFPSFFHGQTSISYPAQNLTSYPLVKSTLRLKKNQFNFVHLILWWRIPSLSHPLAKGTFVTSSFGKEYSKAEEEPVLERRSLSPVLKQRPSSSVLT